MAERTITIRIVNDSESHEPSVGADGGARKDAERKTSDRKAAIRNVAFYATAQIIATVKSISQTGYSRYVSLTENYRAEMAQQNVVAHLGRVANFAGSALGGAIVGAKLGPVGAVVGFMAGAILGGVRNEMSARQTLVEQQRQLHEEAYSLYFNTERAGMVNHSRGTEN